MSFIRKHKAEIIGIACIIAMLTIVFFCGDKNKSIAPESLTNDSEEEITQFQNEPISAPEKVQETEVPESAKEEIKAPAAIKNAREETQKSNIDSVAESQAASDIKAYVADKIPEPAPTPTVKSDAANDKSCTLTVRCDNAIGKTREKESIIPENGIIFSEQKVVFYEGESVFNVLVREMKKNNIHMEFVNVPLYNSAYIEGIANLYEFDCGELSGWMYKVNGWFPNYGCSSYQLKDGDKIELVYTCDLGADVGGSYSARNGR